MLAVIYRFHLLTFLRAHITMTRVRFFLGAALLAAAGFELATSMGTINALVLSSAIGAVAALLASNDAPTA